VELDSASNPSIPPRAPAARAGSIVLSLNGVYRCQIVYPSFISLASPVSQARDAVYKRLRLFEGKFSEDASVGFSFRGFPESWTKMTDLCADYGSVQTKLIMDPLDPIDDPPPRPPIFNPGCDFVPPVCDRNVLICN
jgi:hypothetical protein